VTTHGGPDRPREPLRVAVLGASQATGYGLPVRPDVRRRDRAFPALLHSDPSHEFDVTSYALDGRNLDDTIELLDGVLAGRPDIVVCICGGRESLVRRNGFVARCRRPIPVKGIAHTPRDRGLEWFKTLPWRTVVWLLRRDSQLLERLGARIGFGPEMATEAFRDALTTLTDRVMTQTRAHLFLVRDFSGWQGEFAWWPGQRAANRETSTALGTANPRVSLISAFSVVSSYDEWLPDGAHVNEAGHARFARHLADQIRAVVD
jgi:hypothetical protein